MKPLPRLWYLIPLTAALVTFFALQGRGGNPGDAQPKRGLRIATYNIEWLGERMSTERQSRLKEVLKAVSPDIIAMQEIENRNALARIFDSNWELAIMDDPSEFQEPALAVRKPLRIIGRPTMVFAGDAFEFAFPGKRDVLRAQVQTTSGSILTLYVCHMKSRRESRVQTDAQRRMAAGLLAAYVRGMNEPYAVVLGDFNDTPDDESVNILESGSLLAKGERSNDTGTFLYNLTQPLHDKDYVTLGLHSLYRAQPLSPVVKGARAENDKWRGKTYRYPDDLAVTQSLFDQILVSPRLKETLVGEARIYSGRPALEGASGQTRRNDDGTADYIKQSTRASDHLPVYADFNIPK